MFKKPTKFFEDIIGKGRTLMVALNDFTPLQGGVPIEIDGQIFGAIGVSGANSAQQDEELAKAGAAAVASAVPAQVSFFDHNQVTSAFAKGTVLFDGSDKYMVHASRREQSGMAEVHTKAADIIYVLDGKAKFVTGGSTIDPSTVAPDEIRGREITGGETRQIAKGAVIIVPIGTPH